MLIKVPNSYRESKNTIIYIWLAIFYLKLTNYIMRA